MTSSIDAEPSSYVQGRHVNEGRREKYKLPFSKYKTRVIFFTVK